MYDDGEKSHYLVSLCETFVLLLHIKQMRVRVIKKATIEDFIDNNSQSRESFNE